MHKKLERELISLAHSILQLKNKEDVNALHKKAAEIYEKLSLLKFVNYYFETTPQAEENKKEVLEKITRVWVKNEKDELTPTSEKKEDEIFEEKAQMTLFEEDNQEQKQEFQDTNDTPKELSHKNSDPINIFEVENENPKTDTETTKNEENEEELLDKEPLFKDDLDKETPKKIVKIPLNDRIMIVKNLFENNQSDFNRVLSQINSFDTEQETKNFLNRMVKPDYDWSNYKETEEKLIQYIEEKFK